MTLQSAQQHQHRHQRSTEAPEEQVNRGKYHFIQDQQQVVGRQSGETEATPQE
jgi:hypothetical protein